LRQTEPKKGKQKIQKEREREREKKKRRETMRPSEQVDNTEGQYLPNPQISGLANTHVYFVIASQGEMTSIPTGTTPFFPEIESARGSSVQEIPRSPDDAADQKAAG
jgi:hypothetical protein